MTAWPESPKVPRGDVGDPAGRAASERPGKTGAKERGPRGKRESQQ